jgi:hypothetical protein
MELPDLQIEVAAVVPLDMEFTLTMEQLQILVDLVLLLLFTHLLVRNDNMPSKKINFCSYS